MQLMRKISGLFRGEGVGKSTKPALFLRLALVLICFAILIFFAQLWNSSQPIRSISISGTSFLTPAEVKAAIDDTSIINVPKNKIQYDRIALMLKTNPYIEETYMHEGIHSLNIEVRERNPVALLANNYGELCFVDKDGLLLPYRVFRSAIDMPIISGIFDGEKLDTNLLLISLNILSEIKTTDYNFLYNYISEVHYSSSDKSFELYTSDNGTRVVLGLAENISSKMRNIYEYFRHRLSANPSKRIKYIDARWAEQIVAKYY